MSAIINSEKKHFPVLLNELVNIISPRYDGTFIDCTFGNGGYSKKILEHKKNNILAIDRDKDCHIQAQLLKKKYQNRFSFYNIKFSELNKLNINNANLKGVIFDLGYSLDQIKNLSKGFSFISEGKLNMQMGLNSFSADQAVNELPYEDLWRIFKFFGDEKFCKPIAKKIINDRKKKKIKTEDLVKIIKSVKKKKFTKIDSSTKIFQSLRIFVNQEISELIKGLINAYNLLPKGGIIVVITFHSIEDRIVKFFFKEYSEIKNSSRYLPEISRNEKKFELLNKKPILPVKSELTINPPSRSAKLRYAVKVGKNSNFQTLINKFSYLTEIENLAQKL